VWGKKEWRVLEKWVRAIGVERGAGVSLRKNGIAMDVECDSSSDGDEDGDDDEEKKDAEALFEPRSEQEPEVQWRREESEESDF
jgi:hypothetical protein